jgi:hypothetical protein
VGGTCQVLELRSKACCYAPGVVVTSSSVSVVDVVVVSGAGFAWMCSWLLFFENGIWYAVRLCWGVQVSVSVSLCFCGSFCFAVLIVLGVWVGG